MPSTRKEPNPRKRDKQVARAQHRISQPRVKAAKAEIEESKARVEALLAVEQPGPVVGAQYSVAKRLAAVAPTSPPAPPEPGPATPVKRKRPQPLKVKPVRPVPEMARGDRGWDLRQARSMFRQGYHIDHVVQTTGWGAGHFEDLPRNEHGYGKQTQAQVVSLDAKRARKGQSA